MSLRSNLYCALAVFLAGLVCATPLRAQTNTPPDTATDAERFFTGYVKAVQLIQSKKPQDAAITMRLLTEKLRASPWMEVALLKHSELIDATTPDVAMENYQTLHKRLETAPYFQGDAEHARVFRAALQGALDSGINRVRLRRIRESLACYFSRYSEYPESLAKLAILNYIDMADIRAANDRNFRYIPVGERLKPSLSYQSYQLEPLVAEPFMVDSPRIEGTSLISDKPLKYAALIKIPNRIDSLRVTEDQTLQGYFIGAIAPGGAILCSYNRVLILPVTAEP